MPGRHEKPTAEATLLDIRALLATFITRHEFGHDEDDSITVNDFAYYEGGFLNDLYKLLDEPRTQHDHKAVQHRDGKEPWCQECRLTADYREPKSRFKG
jgi:hypothetical protein